MAIFTDCKNRTAVQKKAREEAFDVMMKAFQATYGEEAVSIVGNNELAVAIGTITISDGTENEVCITVKPVVKDYDVRVTDSNKVFDPYERLKEADAYEDDLADKANKKAKKEAVKRQKMEAERKARASKKE